MPQDQTQKIARLDEVIEKGFRMKPGEMGVNKAIRAVFLGENFSVDHEVRRIVIVIGKDDCLEILRLIQQSLPLLTQEENFQAIAQAVLDAREKAQEGLAERITKTGVKLKAVVSDGKPPANAIPAVGPIVPINAIPKDPFADLPQKEPDHDKLENVLSSGDVAKIKNTISSHPGIITEEKQFEIIVNLDKAGEILMFIAQKYPSAIFIYCQKFLNRPFAYRVLEAAALRCPDLAIRCYEKYKNVSGAGRILADAKRYQKLTPDN